MSHYRKHHRPKPSVFPQVDIASQTQPETSESASTEQSEHTLLVTLFRELFQTEESAKLHPAREAERLGDVEPAAALRAVSAHAARVLSELPGLAEQNNLPISLAGKTLGSFLSNFRQLVIDRLVEPERSYRGTLIGVRHGVDLVELIFHVAQAQENHNLAEWCKNWLSERRPLMEAMAKELAWFAGEPDIATCQPSALRLLGRLKSLFSRIDRNDPASATS